MKKARLTTIDRGVVWGYLRQASIPLLVALLSIAYQQADAQCVMSCFDIQVSVDQDCEATITHYMISDTTECDGPFLVELFDQGMNPIATSPHVNSTHLGMTLIVRVTDLESGNNCWSTALIQDKMPPQPDCDDITMGCWDLPYYPGPDFDDNCTPDHLLDIEKVGEVIDPMPCNEDYVKTVTITWKATDASGNTGYCDQTIYLERIDTSAIEFPMDLTDANGYALHCDEIYDLDGDGAPDPEITGVPTINGIDLYPTPDFYCNMYVTYDDNIFPEIGCVKKIMRLWQVREWYCSEEIVLAMPQIIEIVDEDGPVVTCPPDFTMSTDGNDCSTYAFLPPADAYDVCHDVHRVDISWVDGFFSDYNGTGTHADLPVGQNTITYTAYDECYNSSSCTMNVYVHDMTPPIAVCDQHTAVSLGTDGTARVYAETFDDGSHDECGIDYFEVARMNEECGYDTYFREYVEFNCCDVGAGPRMVRMRVWDVSGNSNECMVEVVVQDKLPALVVCPTDITISCEFPYDMNDLSIFGTVHILDNLNDINDPATDPREDIIIDDVGNPNTSGPEIVGMDGYAYDNCDVTVSVYEYDDIDQCGEGHIYRIFTAEGPGGPSTSCTQVITVKNYFPFDGDYDIQWPNDTTITGGCDLTDISPDRTGRPILDEDQCDLVAVAQPDDWIFNFDDPNDPGCYKVLRKWKVIDWCDFRDNEYMVYTHQQIIKVINLEAPEITGCDDVSICSYDPQCSDAFIDLEIGVTDDCTPAEDLDIRYDIDLDDDGYFDVDETYNPYADLDNLHNQASGHYPVGLHRIVWTVDDLCGNRSTCEYFFEIKNCKKPTPLCINGLSAELMPMDLDSNGSPDWAMIELQAWFFDAGSNHPCYSDDDITVSFSSDVTNTSMMFDCTDLGEQVIELWATAPNGEQDYCVTFVDIQDNNDVCPDNPTSGAVSGAIITSDEDAAILDVEVKLTGDPLRTDMTDMQGSFTFGNVPHGGSYTVDPDKNDDVLNGVSTYDLALIQRHILNVSPITDPYRIIAADVDNSGAIDVLDIVQLRLVILGVQDEFENNNSWRFIDADHVFTTNDPLAEPFAEEYRITNFNGNMMDVNFKGVKIGDINASMDPGGDTRALPPTFNLVASEASLAAGDIHSVAMKVPANTDLISMQYTLAFDPDVIRINKFVDGLMDLNESNVNLTNAAKGLISFSWNALNFESFGKDEILMSIEVEAIRDVRLSNALSITNTVTQTEAYTAAGAEGIELRFNDYAEDLSFELFQNRPNPTNGQTVIGFNLPESSDATITIIDLTGRVIMTRTADYAKGYNEMTIDSRELGTSGVLYYRLDAKDYTATKKMIVLQ